MCCFFLAFFVVLSGSKHRGATRPPSSSEVRNSEKAQPTSKRVEKIIHFLTYQADGAYGAQIFTSQMVTGKIIWVTTAAGRKSLDLSAVFMRKIAFLARVQHGTSPTTPFWVTTADLFVDSGHTVGRRSTISGQYQYQSLFFLFFRGVQTCSNTCSNMFIPFSQLLYLARLPVKLR